MMSTPNNSPAIFGCPSSILFNQSDDDYNFFLSRAKVMVNHPCKDANCKLGSKCLYAHNIDEFIPIACRLEMKNECIKGNRCTFKHASETKQDFVERRRITFYNL